MDVHRCHPARCSRARAHARCQPQQPGPLGGRCHGAAASRAHTHPNRSSVLSSRRAPPCMAMQQQGQACGGAGMAPNAAVAAVASLDVTRCSSDSTAVCPCSAAVAQDQPPPSTSGPWSRATSAPTAPAQPCTPTSPGGHSSTCRHHTGTPP